VAVNRLGFYRTFDPGTAEETIVQYALPGGWKEICRGSDPKLIAKALVERGVIRPDEVHQI
jgi:hypothetical protein